MMDRRVSYSDHGALAWLVCLGAIIISSTALAADEPSRPYAATKIHPTLRRQLDKAAIGAPVKAWVLFEDKGITSSKSIRNRIADLASGYNPRAIERRQKRRTLPGLFDEHDLPVAQPYLDAVSATGAQLRRVSKWVNGVSILGTRAQFEVIAALPAVRLIQPVRSGFKIGPDHVKELRDQRDEFKTLRDGSGGGFYGLAEQQLNQINLTAVHDQGFTGSGVVVGILDTGFQRSHIAFNEPGHPVNVIAEYDFIDDDPDVSIEDGDPSGQHNHGTYILGTLGAYIPGELVGAAYDASFILCKTEDTTDEYPAEEDNYVAGLEFIEANGGDVATSSLSYIDWYTQEDLDGLTAVTTIAVNIATANGVHCLTAARNGGHDSDPTTSTLGAPADALQVITCGAVDYTGEIASFSSDGPTADGRVKPEVLARGVDTQTVSPFSDTSYTGVGGTSLSTPLVAGAVACLVQAHPEWTVDHMRERLFLTADFYVAHQVFDPQYVYGYGVMNAIAAMNTEDCNGNGVDDGIDIANGTSPDTNGNGIPDECEVGACCACAPDSGCLDTTLVACDNSGGYFVADQVCALALCPPLTPPNDDSANAIQVDDGPTGFTTACATTDGPVTTAGTCVFDPPDRFQNDIWFDYTAICDGRLSIGVLDTDFDAVAAVYCDDTESCSAPPDSSTEYACGPVNDIYLSDVMVNFGKCYKIRIGGLDGDVGGGTLDIICEDILCPFSDPPSPDPQVTDFGHGTRNRYLAFEGGGLGGYAEAIRVRFTDLPTAFEEHEGATMWVGPPFEVSEASGSPVGPPPMLTVAMLQCEPYYTDWSLWGTVHIFGPEVVPEAIYELQAIESVCAPTRCYDLGEIVYSSPLTVHTSSWGDLVGDCSPTGCTPPQGTADFVDITAVVDKFRNLEGAPSKSRTDLSGDSPDLKIDFVDISHAVDAFRGMGYPFDGPIGCD